MKRLKGIAVIRYFLLFIIKIYQYGLSPFLGQQCRFWPSCSAYSYEAISRYGSIKGLSLSIKRILKCHPYNPGGCDPVP